MCTGAGGSIHDLWWGSGLEGFEWNLTLVSTTSWDGKSWMSAEEFLHPPMARTIKKGKTQMSRKEISCWWRKQQPEKGRRGGGGGGGGGGRAHAGILRASAVRGLGAAGEVADF